MKKLSISLLINAAVLTMTLPSASYAATSIFTLFSDTVSSPSQLNLPPCKNDIDCLFAGYGPSMQGETVRMPNDATTTDAIWKGQTSFFPPTIANTDTDARKQLANFFTLPLTSNTDYNWLYSFSPTIDSNCQNPGKTGFFSCSIKVQDIVKNYNFDNYFGVLTYNNNTQQQAASNFIKFSTMQISPVVVANVTQLVSSSAEFDKVLANNSDLQNYLGVLRLYAAIQSTAKSNLDYFYTQRLPFERTNQDGSVTKASDAIRQTLSTLQEQDPTNFPSKDPTQVSPLQLENYMATHRLTDSWLMNLTKDSPVMLQRQLVILQTENLAETHRLRMSIDRLTATMSLIMMQNSYTMRQLLSAQKDEVEATETDQSSP